MSIYTAERTTDGVLLDSESRTRKITLTDDEWDAIAEAAKFQEQLDEVLEDITSANTISHDELKWPREDADHLRTQLWEARTEASRWEDRFNDLLDRVLERIVGGNGRGFR